MRKIWPFSFYFLYFSAMASLSPFLVLYYQDLGFNGAQIGLLTGITPLITFFFAPLWTSIADTTGRHRLFMSVNLLMGVVLLVLMPAFESFVPFFTLIILFNAFFAPISAFVDSATMFMLADQQDLYGRLRLGGTVGYGIFASVAGVIVQDMGLKIAFYGAAFLLMLSLIVSQKMEHDPEKSDRSTRGNARILLSNPRWLLFLIIGFTAGLSLSASNTYFYPYMREIGASESTMGLALSIGTIVEIPVLLFVNRVIQRFKSYRLLMFSMAITATRMLLLAIFGSPAIILLIQTLNGFTFALMWVAGVSYASENAPKGMRSSAQGLFTAMVIGIGNAVGGFASGFLLENIGGRGLYLVFGSIVVVILLIVTLIKRRLPVESASIPVSAVE